MRVWVGLSILFSVACTTLSGIGDLYVDNADTSPTSSNTPKKDAGKTKDGGNGGTVLLPDGAVIPDPDPDPDPNPDSGNPTGPTKPTRPANPIVFTTFDTAEECTSWTSPNGGEISLNTDSHSAPSSCRLCAPNGGDVDMEKKGIVPVSGQLSISVFLRRPEGATTPTSFAIEILWNTSSVKSSKSGTGWVEFTGPKIGMQPGQEVTVRLGIRGGAANDCLLADDVIVAIN